VSYLERAMEFKIAIRVFSDYASSDEESSKMVKKIWTVIKLLVQQYSVVLVQIHKFMKINFVIKQTHML